MEKAQWQLKEILWSDAAYPHPYIQGDYITRTLSTLGQERMEGTFNKQLPCDPFQ